MTDNFKPYYAVIFTSIKVEAENNYADVANRMVELAATHQGFIGVESARNEIGITISYWESLEAIKDWKNNAEHLIAQQLGKDFFINHTQHEFAKLNVNIVFKNDKNHKHI